jgi:hypothetical protein
MRRRDRPRGRRQGREARSGSARRRWRARRYPTAGDRSRRGQRLSREARWGRCMGRGEGCAGLGSESDRNPWRGRQRSNAARDGTHGRQGAQWAGGGRWHARATTHGGRRRDARATTHGGRRREAPRSRNAIESFTSNLRPVVVVIVVRNALEAALDRPIVVALLHQPQAALDRPIVVALLHQPQATLHRSIVVALRDGLEGPGWLRGRGRRRLLRANGCADLAGLVLEGELSVDRDGFFPMSSCRTAGRWRRNRAHGRRWGGGPGTAGR